MRTLLHSFPAIIFSSILLWGCSGEEPSKPSENAAVMVKKPVVKPPMKKPEAEAAPTLVKEGSQGTAAVSPTTEEKVGSGGNRLEAAAAKSKRIEDPAKKTEAGQTGTESKPSTDTEESKGSYIVKKGDTLAAVAARKDICGDRLKWPILYRLNAQALNALPAENLPDLPLPDGAKLRILTREEVARNLEKRAGNIWVVNVLSAMTSAEVIPAVINLVRNDYPVYVAAAKVNDKDWMRVRVGFFKTKEEAEAEGKRIMGLMSLQDSWVTKLTKAEFAEFAGF
jgi:cell division septation protein DedD